MNRLRLLFSLLLACLLFLVSNVSKAEYKPLGPVHLGATVGVGAPSLVSTQLVFKYKKYLGANLEFGMLPRFTIPLSDGDITIRQQMVDFSVLVYPFKGAFFLGMGIGAQRFKLTGAASTTYEGHPVNGDAVAQLNTLFLSPKLGFLYRFPFGLAIGSDLAVEVPLSGTVSASGTGHSPELPGVNVPLPVPQNAMDAANKYKLTPVPVLHVLQLGYLF